MRNVIRTSYELFNMIVLYFGRGFLTINLNLKLLKASGNPMKNQIFNDLGRVTTTVWSVYKGIDQKWAIPL